MSSDEDKAVSLISDRAAELYTLRVLVGSRQVGHLFAVIDSESEVLLSEVIVNKELASPSGSPNWMPRWLRRKPATKSFRCRGYGTKMLLHFLGWCREMGISEAYGSVVQQDLEETPGLLEWYQRRGFEVVPPDDRCLRDAVRMVVWRDANIQTDVNQPVRQSPPMNTISQLFKDEPTQWGLRGDPHLWEGMKAKLGLLPLPEASAELERILRSTFTELTGRTWDNHEPIFVVGYADGGMSSGMVSPEFWRDEAIPLILNRFRASR